MRINHIESLNAACTGVRKLAEAAIAEHRRQIALLESVGREAAALAEVTFTETEPASETEPAELQPVEMRTQAAPLPPHEAKFADKVTTRLRPLRLSKKRPPSSSGGGRRNCLAFRLLRSQSRQPATS